MKKAELAVLVVKLGEADTLGLMVAMGETEASAKEKIAAALLDAEEEIQKAELSEVTQSLKKTLLDFGENSLTPIMPSDTAFFDVILCYTSEELEVGTSDSPQIIPPGYYVQRVRIRREGMDKAVSLFRGSKHKSAGGSNGTTVVVPVPSDAPFKSWVKRLEAAYPEKDDSGKFIVKRGSGQSAPVNLQKAKDPVFLAAKQIALDDGGRQATWGEIEEAIG